MNPTLETKIECILRHSPPAVRDELSQYLRGCGFSDPEDPALNAIVAQSIIAGQPIRLVERDGMSVATEAGLARLGDRLEDTLWGAFYPKWVKIFAVWLISAILSGAGVWLWTQSSRWHDERIKLLNRLGVNLQVEIVDDTTRVYFSGLLQPVAVKDRDGHLYFLFPRK